MATSDSKDLYFKKTRPDDKVAQLFPVRTYHRVCLFSNTPSTYNEEKSALEIWKKALDNVTPQVEVKSRRVGGATFQVPTEIRPDRKESVSMKNLIIFARKRGGKSMADKLAAEIMDAYNEQGGAYKRKEDMHRMAEANRAFAHFRF